MNLLLDTHAYIWWGTDDKSLEPSARAALSDPSNAVYLSVVSAWEIGLKASLRRLYWSADIEEEIQRRGINPLDITMPHAAAAIRLPPHHADPFDRMLIAQARIEGLTIVTRDREIAKYDVPILKT